MTRPLISIIIPIYAREVRMLRDSLDSAFAQHDAEIEVIVVDDGSPEPVAPFLAEDGRPIIALRQDNAGIGAARNAGIAASSGEYVGFLDSDDVWQPDKLSAQLAVFAGDDSVDAVFGRAEQFYDDAVDDAFRARHPMKALVIDAWLSTAMLIRRSSFDRVGPYCEDDNGGVDIDWFMRARELGLDMRMLEQVVYRRRIHHSNNGITTQEESHKGRLLALKRSLDRRRAEAGVDGDS